MTEQQLILIDKENKPSGKYALKILCHTGRGLTHLAFTIMVLNSRNDVLLQDRKHKLWNHFWDLTNSHPLYIEDGKDESIKQAAARCLKTEWGVDFPTKELFYFRYFAAYENGFCENEYCAFLSGKHDGEVFPFSEVAYGYKWMPIDELMADVKSNPGVYTPWLIRGLLEMEKRKLLKFS